MERTFAVAALKREVPAVRALGAAGLYLFGSTVRNEASGQSDLDLFVDYDAAGRFSLVEPVGIKQLLERRLGVSVDMTTRDSLDPLLRAAIENSAEPIF
jgi:predicted nucleotidyltransferase